MKRKLIIAVGLLVVLAALIVGYLQKSEERKAGAQRDQPIAAESRVKPATNGGTLVNLDQGTQKLIGLETTNLALSALAQEIKGYGRVLDPAPLVGMLRDIASARVALDASAKEYQRVKGLYEREANASARVLETGEATMKRDQIALNAAEAQLMSVWGSAVAQQPDAAFVQSLAIRQTALVRLDLPSGELLTETPTGGRLLAPGIAQDIDARFLGRAATTDPQTQGAGFLLLATNALGRLTPGLALTGFLQLPGEAVRGVIVPDRALVRAEERAWVYVQTTETGFMRRSINLNHPLADGWFVTTGVSSGERLVVTAAQTLLSEERKAQIKIGD
jgi:hypothetical protein